MNTHHTHHKERKASTVVVPHLLLAHHSITAHAFTCARATTIIIIIMFARSSPTSHTPTSHGASLGWGWRHSTLLLTMMLTVPMLFDLLLHGSLWQQPHCTPYALCCMQQHLFWGGGPWGPHRAPHHVSQGPTGCRGGVGVMEAMQGGGEDDTPTAPGGGMVNDQHHAAGEYATIVHVFCCNQDAACECVCGGCVGGGW